MYSIIKPCNTRQLPEILEIFNYEILHTTALYDYKPRTVETMLSWFASKQKGNFPVIGAFDSENTLLGFATYGPFRDRPAYKYTVEHSVYVRHDKRGGGIGKILLKEIINDAKEKDYHVLVGGIDASNTASIKLHETSGFVFSGTIHQAGYKFSKWLDLSFYQLILKTPDYPDEE